MLPAMTCDNTREVLPTREAHTSFGVQGFCRVSYIRWSIPTFQCQIDTSCSKLQA